MTAEYDVVTSETPSPSLRTTLDTSGGAFDADLSDVDALTTNRPAIDKIPPELLQLVFEYATVNAYSLFWDATDADCNDGAPGDLWLASMRLAAVCHDWRRIALATPSLWSRITVIISSVFGVTLDPYAAALQLQLDRAGAQPMRLLLLVDYDAPFPDDADTIGVDEFIHMLKRVVRRSAQATVMYIRPTFAEPHPKDAARLRNLFEAGSRALKRLTVAMISDEDDPVYVPLGLVDMPFIQSVAGINSLHLVDVIPRIPDDIVFQTLKDLEIDVDELHFGSIARLLKTSPQLQRLALRTCSIGGPYQEPVSHTTLTFLHIQVKQLNQESAFLTFCLPALEHADIYFDFLPKGEEILSTYQQDLVRSVCRGVDKLQHLTIRYAEAGEQSSDAANLQTLKTSSWRVGCCAPGGTQAHFHVLPRYDAPRWYAQATAAMMR